MIKDRVVQRLKKKIKGGTLKERKIEAEKIIANYMDGHSQDVRGKIASEVIEKFLETLEPEAREAVEETTRTLFQLRDYTRFRRKAILHLISIYEAGLENGAHGVTLDIEKMFDEAADKVEAERQ